MEEAGFPEMVESSGFYCAWSRIDGQWLQTLGLKINGVLVFFSMHATAVGCESSPACCTASHKRVLDGCWNASCIVGSWEA